MSTTAQPTDIPVYELQALVSSVNEPGGPFSLTADETLNEIRCAQALGTELYVGCANGELLRYALEEHPTTKQQSYVLQSRQSLPQEKAIDEIVLVPSIARVLIQSAHQIFFYTLPSLDPVPQNLILPLRNVITFAVDERHLARAPLSTANPQAGGVEPVDFCVVKRSSIALFQLRERLFFQKDMPLPAGTTVSACRRTGRYLCFADAENYNVVDLETSSLIPLLPITQAPVPIPLRPSITAVSAAEFLILSWTGVSALGVFITGAGEPVRGTLEWPAYPDAVSLDHPHIHALLPDQSIEIHNLDSQTLVQVLPPPSGPPEPTPPGWPPVLARMRLVAGFHPYTVPSADAAARTTLQTVKLVRG